MHGSMDMITPDLGPNYVVSLRASYLNSLDTGIASIPASTIYSKRKEEKKKERESTKIGKN